MRIRFLPMMLGIVALGACQQKPRQYANELRWHNTPTEVAHTLRHIADSNLPPEQKVGLYFNAMALGPEIEFVPPDPLLVARYDKDLEVRTEWDNIAFVTMEIDKIISQNPRLANEGDARRAIINTALTIQFLVKEEATAEARERGIKACIALGIMAQKIPPRQWEKSSLDEIYKISCDIARGGANRDVANESREQIDLAFGKVNVPDTAEESKQEVSSGPSSLEGAMKSQN